MTEEEMLNGMPEAVAEEEEPTVSEEVEETVAVVALQGELNEMKDRYLRAHAEMENVRKRFDRERQEIVKYGKESLLQDFLVVYDAIEKSIAMAVQVHPDDENFIEGLKMTEKMFLDVLKRNSVEPIEATGQIFDPNYHEAMLQVEHDAIASGMVVEEIERGFIIHDRVLRPAKVTVAK